MAIKVGRIGAVKIGDDKVSEMGVWSIDGMQSELLEFAEFGDEIKEFELGLTDYGTVSFNGFWDMTDATGQKILQSHFDSRAPLTDLRFYVDNTSYYTEDRTGFTGSQFFLQNISINFDKAGIGTISFQAKISGKLTLV